MRHGAAFAITLVTLLGASRVARAACEGRPTDAGAYMSISTGAPASFDAAGGRVRVHYATTGAAAIDQTTTAPNTAPDFAVRAAEIAEDAVARYEAFGYRAVVSDATPCASNGGDGRIDLYFVSFGAGDGQTAPEICAGRACNGYMMVEANPLGYASDEEALKVIVPHELFHMVQYAYTPDLPAWLAEGTAQWATDKLDPVLTDMEAFFPAWFEEADRSIDSPPGGAAGAYLYGAAVFPLFLDQAHDDRVVLDTLEGIHGGAAVFPALDAALVARSSDVARTLPLFQAYTLATGSRHGELGFTDGGDYPMRDVTTLDVVEGELVSAILVGFGSRAYFVDLPTDAGSRLTFTADPARLAAHFVPARDGKADLAARAPLGEVVSGPGFLLVSGISTSKQDAPFSIARAVEPLPENTTATTTGASGATSGGNDDDGAGGGETGDAESGSCDCATAPHGVSALGWLAPVALAIFGARRARRARR